VGFFDGCPGSRRIKEPFPETVKCRCGKEIEIFSDEAETTCPHCKKKISRHMPQSCLDWCSMAKDCICPGKYNKYKKHNKKNSLQ